MGNSQSSNPELSSSHKENTSLTRSRSGSRHGTRASASRKTSLSENISPLLRERGTHSNDISTHSSPVATSARMASPRQVQNVKYSSISESPFVGSPLIHPEDLLVDAVAPRLASLSTSPSQASPKSARRSQLSDSGFDKSAFSGKYSISSSSNPMVSHSGLNINNLPQPDFFPLSLPNSKYNNDLKDSALSSKEKSVYANPLADAEGGLPTLITWNSPAKNVYVTGTFNGWKHKIPLGKSSNEFSTVINFPPGIHHIKFIVDDEWKCSNDLLTATDQDGNLVNYIEVDDSTSPLYDSYSQKPDISSSPPGEYANTIPDFNLEVPVSKRRDSTASANSETSHRPPLLPPHLEKVLLNAVPIHSEGLSKGAEDSWLLPVPNHVVLNHLYACSIRDGVMAVAGTSRYRNKLEAL